MKKKLICFFVAMSLILATIAFGCDKNHDTDNSLKTPTIEALKTANTKETVLENYTNILITKECIFENGEKSKDEYFYSKHGNAIRLDTKSHDTDGNVINVMNAVDGAYYNKTASNVYSVIFSHQKDTNAEITKDIVFDFSSSEILGVPTSSGNEICLRSTVAENDTSISHVMYFDAETLLLTNTEETVYSVDTNSGTQTLLRNQKTKYQYGVNYSPDTSAYETITNPDEQNKIEINLVVNPKTNNEFSRSFVLSKSAFLQTTPYSNENYTFYENEACTRDVPDLQLALKESQKETVYYSKKQKEMSFEFTLKDEDIIEFQTIIENFGSLALAGNDNEKIKTYYEKLIDKLLYFQHQFKVAEILYMNDNLESSAIAYQKSMTVLNDANLAFVDIQKELYNSTSPFKEIYFASWKQSDIDSLFDNNETFVQLNQQATQILINFNSLDVSDVTWSEQVDTLYESFVSINNQIATLSGYANYYEFANDVVFQRKYTPEQRQAVRTNLANYFAPLFEPLREYAQYCQKSLTPEQMEEYNFIMSSPMTSLSDKYLGDYIQSFDGTLKTKLESMFTKNSVFFSTNPNSTGTAFVNFSKYYNEPFAFFSASYQNLFNVIHELGHYVSMFEYQLEDLGYDFVETHSQANEWLLMYFLKDKVDSKIFEALFWTKVNQFVAEALAAIILDEFEETVYSATTPYQPSDYKNIMTSILQKYNMPSFFDNLYQIYIQKIYIVSPCYYLNYATSKATSIGFYLIAETEGYAVAQEKYRKLQEDCNPDDSFVTIIQSINAINPFVENDIKKLSEFLTPPKN